MEKNLLNYIISNTKDLDYVVSIEPYYVDNEFKMKELLIKDINKFSNYLNSKANNNNKIAIFMENCNNFVKAFYSILLNNCIVISINSGVELDELEDIIRKNNLELILTNNKNIEKLKKSSIKDIINVDELNCEQENDTLNFVSKMPDFEDVLVVSYTSGTSDSYSKGVELTYKNITFVSEEYTKVYKLNDQSKIITVLPLWHNYAMFACLTSSIASKATLVLMDKWDSKLFLDINKIIKPDVFPGSPYMYIDLINNHEDKLILLDNLKVCDSGGDSLPIECINKFEKLTGAIITEGYGLTETASLTHFNFSAAERKVGSLGKVVSNTECKILDLEGKELPNGEWGLLWIKGPMVFKEYVGLEGLADKVKKDGWFNTNDVVKRDDEGFYYIAGRFTDLKSLKGEDEQLRSLENKLYKFEGISRVHVKTNYNEIANFHYFDIIAILKENYSIQNLYDYINNNLKEFIIGEVKIVEELPTTGTGKIKRNKINNLLSINLDNYTKKELYGGMRCKTVHLSGKEDLIYQEYIENAKYQAKKKFDITNLIHSNVKTDLISKALTFEVEDDKSWLVTEYKTGKMLSVIRKEDSNFSLNVIAKDLAKCLFEIHNIKVESKYGWITDNEVFENEKFTDYLKSELRRFKECVENSIDKKHLNIMLEKGNECIEMLSEFETSFKPQLIWFDLNPNNILINKENGKYSLSAVLDPGGARYGIKEWDLAFLRMEVCKNEEEFQAIFKEYQKLDNTISEEVIKKLCIFIELDDMIIRVLDEISLPAPYDTQFKEIIEYIEK